MEKRRWCSYDGAAWKLSMRRTWNREDEDTVLWCSVTATTSVLHDSFSVASNVVEPLDYLAETSSEITMDATATYGYGDARLVRRLVTQT